MTPAVDVCVVGSINLDIVIAVPHHPAPGETVMGADKREFHGGKGANQAVAAARLGRSVAFVGLVGDDDAGGALRAGLVDDGIDVSGLRTIDGPSGTALIAVSPEGENTIIVAPGANGQVDPATVEAARDSIAAAKVVLLGHEIPADAVACAAALARGRVLLNPAPARPVAPELLARVDVLIPNQGELRALASSQGPLESVAADLHRAVVVTLGADGVLVVADGSATRIAAPRVDAVDTTGAGDTFCGALADALARDAPLVEAARWAVEAAAISVTRPGARGGMPRRSDMHS